MPGVTITLSGASSATTTTDAEGNYTFLGLADNSNYTITPNLSGYTFSPVYRSVTINGSNIILQTFLGTSSNKYSISGAVRRTNGSGVQGIMIGILGPYTNLTTTTDSSGNYAFTELANDSYYTIEPLSQGYSYEPVIRGVEVRGSNVIGQDFTARADKYYLRGTIKRADGSAIAGVTVTLSGGASGIDITDSNGKYEFSVENGAYTITPGSNGYIFNPASINATISGANLVGQDFTGSPTFSISGNVKTAGGTPIAGVTMTLSGAANKTTTTAGNGNYTFTGMLNGSYSITPALTDYTFAPTEKSVNINNANVTGQDFTGDRKSVV
jgi:K+-transporting ATPase c subunit